LRSAAQPIDAREKVALPLGARKAMNVSTWSKLGTALLAAAAAFVLATGAAARPPVDDDGDATGAPDSPIV